MLSKLLSLPPMLAVSTKSVFYASPRAHFTVALLPKLLKLSRRLGKYAPRPALMKRPLQVAADKAVIQSGPVPPAGGVQEDKTLSVLMATRKKRRSLHDPPGPHEMSKKMRQFLILKSNPPQVEEKGRMFLLLPRGRTSQLPSSQVLFCTTAVAPDAKV